MQRTLYCLQCQLIGNSSRMWFTVSGKVIHEDDFTDEMRRWSVQHAVNCPQQCFPRLVVKYYYDARVRQLVRKFHVTTPGIIFWSQPPTYTEWQDFSHSLVKKLTRSFCRTGRLLNSFENRVVTVWNSLPCHIVCSPSVVSFKKNLENHDLSNFCTVFGCRL